MKNAPPCVLLTPKEEKPLESKFFDVKSEKNTEYKILFKILVLF